MNEKLKNILSIKSIEELASLRSIAASICNDYDKNLTTYATLNDDRSFLNMPPDVKDMHERRTKMFGLLMSINKIIEEKLFKLYE